MRDLSQFAELVGLGATFNGVQKAQEATRKALAQMRALPEDFPADASTIRRLEIQLGKFDKLTAKARKAMSKATRAKLPKVLKDFYTKEMRKLKRTLPASVFGTPTYRYASGGSGGSFIISVPMLDSAKPLTIALRIEVDKKWNRSGTGYTIKGQREQLQMGFGNLSWVPGGNAQSILEYLIDRNYQHIPKSVLQEQEETLATLNAIRLPSGYEKEDDAQTSRGIPYLRVEWRTNLRWEYDQDSMSRGDWERAAERAITEGVSEIKRRLPRGYEVVGEDIGEKGHASATIRKVSSVASRVADRFLEACGDTPCGTCDGCGCGGKCDGRCKNTEEAMHEKTSPAPELPPGKG